MHAGREVGGGMGWAGRVGGVEESTLCMVGLELAGSDGLREFGWGQLATLKHFCVLLSSYQCLVI